jgi:hypothetical protein
LSVGPDSESADEVIVKLEHYSVTPSFLREEADIFRDLAGNPGFPKVCWFGQQDDFTVLVFELLGRSLEDLFR